MIEPSAATSSMRAVTVASRCSEGRVTFERVSWRVGYEEVIRTAGLAGSVALPERSASSW